jgi:hypothetical protein
MAGVYFQAVESEYLGADRFGPVSVGEKAAWPDPDGDNRRIPGLKGTHFA